MNIPHHYAQAGQDLFAQYALRGESNPTFIDIGCSDGKTNSNSLLLEESWWTGILVDSNPDAIDACSKFRKAQAICADACKVDLSRFHKQVGYLSCDVDDATLSALNNLLAQGFQFEAITIEHDTYRLGDKLREPQRRVLSHDYALVCSDVTCDGLIFEDWWVAKPIFQSVAAIKCDKKDWKEIVSKMTV